MKSQKIIFLLLAMLMMALSAIALSATTLPNDNEPFLNNDKATTDEDFPETENQGQTTTLTHLKGMSRFLASRGDQMTCNRYPTECRTKEPGPDCCKKKCVDMSSDEVNCGKCGKKCKYGEICCKGKCVKPTNDEGNCGSCNNKCSKGNKCLYGMCSYA